MRHAFGRAVPLALFVVTSLVPSANTALALKGAAAGEGTADSFASVDAVSLIQSGFPEFAELQKLGDALQRMMAKREEQEEPHRDDEEDGADPGLEWLMANATRRIDSVQRIIERGRAKLGRAADKTASGIHALPEDQEDLPPAESPQRKLEGDSRPSPGRPRRSRPAHGHPTNKDLELDGGGEPWVLFSDSAPLETPEDEQMPEAFVPADPSTDPMCVYRDEKGYRYYNVSVPHLVPFIVPQGDRKRNDAALIVVPGGQGLYLSWHKEGTHVAKWLNSLGYSAFVLKHRVPKKSSKWPKATIDGQRALRLVRSRASEFGLNPDRIGAIGFGTGGVVAAHLSRAAPEYEAADEVDKERHKPDYQLMIYAANVAYPTIVEPRVGPTFMAIARDDTCTNSANAVKYYEGLVNNGNGHVPHELHIFAEGGHGYGDCSLFTEGMTVKEACMWMHNAAAYMRSMVLQEYDEIPATVRRLPHP